MSDTIHRGPDKQVLAYVESTPGFPAVLLLETKLGRGEFRFAPTELIGSNPPRGEALIACIAGGASARAVARVTGAKEPRLPRNGYRIEAIKQRAGRALVVTGGDLFGMLAGLSDLALHSEITPTGLIYRGGDKTEKPALALRYYWTWDHSTNWMLDDPGNQVEGCNNRYFKRPETYVEDYRRLVDHCIDMRFNGIVIWGFLRDAHGGEKYAYEVARYAADRGVAIMPGVGTTGYGGVYYQGVHPCNLETHLAANPRLGNTNKDRWRSHRESSPYYQENQEWIARSLAWLYQNFPIGGVNLENNDYMVDYSPAGKRGRAKIRSREADHFKDQYFAYKTALNEAQRLAPDLWNTYATYSGFNRGTDVTNAGASMGAEPYFARHMPPTAIAQWTLTGMLSAQPAALRDWMESPRPGSVYENPRWPEGLRPPTPRSCGFIHQASQWSGVRRNAPALSTFAEGCLRSFEEGLEGISVHGEVTSRTLAWRLNYLVMRHWTYHPQSTLEQFALDELAPRVGGEAAARDFARALCLLEEGKPDDVYKLAHKHRAEHYPYPYPDRGDLEISRTWRELCEWASLKAHPQWAHGFVDVV